MVEGPITNHMISPLPMMPMLGSPGPPVRGAEPPPGYSLAPARPHPRVVAAAPSQAVFPIWRGQRH